MLPEWILWVLIWWFCWFALVLDWYYKKFKRGEKGKQTPLTFSFMLLFSGFIPIIFLLVIFSKSKTKR